MKYTSIPLLLLLVFSCQQAADSDTAQSGTSDTVVIATLTVEDTIDEKIPPSLPPIDYDSTEWTEVVRLDRSIGLDLRYATDSNFVEEQMYDCGRCFLRPAVAKAVVKVHQQLQEQGLGIRLFDCYRPRPIQWKLWEKVPDPRYVSDPRKGSMHNRGAAVDLTLVDSTGQQLEMGTPYDFFGPEAYPAYRGLPEQVLANRELLHEAMKTEGFQPIRTEWWHFSLPGKGYELSDMLWKCY